LADRVCVSVATPLAEKHLLADPPTDGPADEPDLRKGAPVSEARMALTVLPEAMAISRLGPDEPTPDWLDHGGFYCLTHTGESLTVVTREVGVPEQVECDRGWRCLEVRGPLALNLTGVLASLTAPLARAGVPVFVVSSYETDFLLVKESMLTEAKRALEQAGHVILG
jgi:hypothetical protein